MAGYRGAGLWQLWQESGDVANGTYFWTYDFVIVPEPGIAVMTDAFCGHVRSGDITCADCRSGR